LKDLQKMSSKLSTLTLEKHNNLDITNRYYINSGIATAVTVYINTPNETYPNASTTFRFTDRDDLKLFINAFKKEGFHPYQTNKDEISFSFINMNGAGKTFYNMADMKATIGVDEKTCLWNNVKSSLNIPNTCLSFEQIKKLLNDSKEYKTVDPLFTTSVNDFPLLQKPDTTSPTFTPIDKFNKQKSAINEPDGDKPVHIVRIVDNKVPTDVPTDATRLGVLKNNIVYPQGIPCLVNGYKGELIQGPHGQFVMTNELGPVQAMMCVLVNGSFMPIYFTI